MKLQADPTVIYSIKQKEKNFKKIIKRVFFRDLNLDSEYNTYRYFGLPPGPICMPDISSIDAVLNYRKHNYLYFVANPNKPGYHSFSKNLKEHNYYRRIYLNWLRKK
ncbi:MAG: endolytic transglycosylase MltG [Flavobacteriaceae bacterium]